MHRAAAAAEEAQPLRKRPSNPDFEQPVFRQHDPSTTERACMADPAGTRHRRARGKRDTVPITEGLTVSAKSLRPLVSDGSRSAGAPCGHRSRGKKKKKKTDIGRGSLRLRRGVWTSYRRPPPPGEGRPSRDHAPGSECTPVLHKLCKDSSGYWGGPPPSFLHTRTPTPSTRPLAV